MGGEHRINYSVDGMRLNVNGTDDGAVKSGDTVHIDIHGQNIWINGVWKHPPEPSG